MKPDMRSTTAMTSIATRSAQRIGHRRALMATTALIAALSFVAVPALAQTWDGGGADADWGTGLNWSANAVPAAGGTAIVGGAGGANADPTVSSNTNDLDATDISGGTVTVDAVLHSLVVTVSGTGTLTVSATGDVRGSSTPTDTTLNADDDGIVNNNGTITGALILGGGTVNNAGVVTGATSVNSGTLNLDPGTNLADSQGLTVNGGTVNVNASDTVGTFSGTGGTVDIDGGQTLTVTQGADDTFAGVLSGSGTFAKGGASTLTLTGVGTQTGAIDVNAGTLALSGAGATASTDIDVAPGATLAADGGAFATGTAIDLAGTGALTLTGNESIAELDASATSTTTLTGATLTLNSGGSVLAGVIGGTGGVTVAGGLSNMTAANTYTGTTAVTGGTLVVNGAGALASTTVNVSGGVLETDTSSLATGATLTVSDTGAYVAFGDESFAALTQTGGTVQSNIADVTLTLSGAFNQSGGTTTGASGFDINAASFAQSGGATLGSNTTVTSSGAQSLNGGTIAGNLDGAGAITAASGTTGITGTVTNAASLGVSGGNVNLGGTGSVDTATNAVTVSAGTLSDDGDGLDDGETVTVSGIGTLTVTGTDTVAALNQNGGTINGNSIITATGAFNQAGGTTGGTVGIVANGFTQSGGAAIIAAGTSVTSTGAQTLQGGTIAGALDGTGAVTVNTGTTTLSGTIAATDVTIQAGGVLSSNGGGLATTAALSNAGTLALTGGGAEAIASLNGAGTTTLSSGSLLTLDAGVSAISGVISGAGGLTVQGTSATTLSGANTYTGATTLTAGSLTLAGGSAIADGAVLAVDGGLASLDADETVGGIAGGGGALAIGANDLTFGGNNADAGFAGGITGLAGSDLEKVGTGTTTLSGTVSTAGTVTVTAGTLALSGANTIAGITVDAGTLRLLSDGAAGGGAGQITATGSVISYGNGINSATPIALNSDDTQLEVLAADSAEQSGAITEDAQARPIEKIGTGTLLLSGPNTFTGLTTVTAGTLNVQNGAAIADTSGVSVATGATFGLLSAETVGFVTGTGTVALGANVLTLNGDGDATAGETFSFGGAISGTGGLVKDGDDRQVLTGASTYSGATAVDAGVLNIQNATALGTAAGATSVAAGAALEVQGGITVAEAITINGTGIAGDGAIRNVAGANDLSGAITLGSAARINSDAGTLVLSGGIGGAGQTLTLGGAGATVVSGAIATTTGGLVKDGAGAATLSGANTYTGTTAVNAGTLVVTGGSAIADSGNVVVGNGATFTVNTGEVIGNLSSADTVNSTATVANNAGLGIAGSAATIFDGNIAGAGQLTYQGTGSLSLTGTSTMTGPLVSTGAGGGGEIAIVDDASGNNGSVATESVLAIAGGTIRTDGGAFGSSAVIAVDAGTLTLTGSETVSALTGNAVTDFTGTVNLNGPGTTLTLNGSTASTGIAGVVAGTGSLVVSGGTTTVAAAGNVQTATTIGGGGTVANGGTMAAVTNAGSFAATAATTGALSNTGTAAVTGGTTASVTNAAGVTTLAGATVTGAVTNSGGTINSTGLTTALSVVNGAIFNAQGTLDADVTNTGVFNLTDDLSGAGSTFVNDGTLNIIDGSYTGLGLLANSEVVNVTGRTLSATSITNADRIILTGGFIGGAFTNSATGIVQFNGASGLSSGSFAGGVLDGTAGGTDRATDPDGGVGDSFTLAAGTVLDSTTSILNVNSSTQAGDQIIVAPGASITGNQNFIFRELSGVLALNQPTVVVVGDRDGYGVNFTVQTADGSGPAFGGTVVYSLINSGAADLALVQESSAGVGGIAAGVSLTQALIGNVVNRPTSPFASGLAAEEGCSQGGFARGTLGKATIGGTSTTLTSSRSQTVNADYYGAQAGYDFGCNDGRFFGGWDAAFGALVGYNAGSTDQPVLVNTGLGVSSVASTTLTDFDQTYVGLYAVASKERLTADVQLRFDNTKFQLSERVNPGFLGLGLEGEPEFDTDTVTVSARVSYQVPLNENGLAFVPTAGFSYSHTSEASFAFDNGDRLNIDAFDSTVGFIGGTLAKQSISEDGLSGQAVFGSLNYYNEFGDDRTSTFLRGADADEISSSTIGAFGEASVGWNYVRVLDNGPGGARQFNANVRADARFGENVEDSYSLTAQVRLSF